MTAAQHADRKHSLEVAPAGQGGGFTDKIEKFGWTLKDKPGQLRFVHKDEFHVDPSYQREEITRKILDIASGWSWMACGALIVAIRAGVIYTVDGNHRVLAARRRSDIQTLPCVVFETDDVVDEANGFLRANTNRKALSGIDKFKAMVVIGDEATKVVDQVVRKSGYRITGTIVASGRGVKCVTALVKLARKDEELFRAMWPLWLEVVDGGPVYERIVASTFWIEERLRGSPQSLLSPPWRQRLIRLGSQGVLDAAAKAAVYYARGGSAAIFGEGVVNALNKGLRNPLVIPTGSEPEG